MGESNGSRKAIMIFFSETDPFDIDLWERIEEEKAIGKAEGKAFKVSTRFKKQMLDWLILRKLNRLGSVPAVWEREGSLPQIETPNGDEEDVSLDDELLQDVINTSFDFD